MINIFKERQILIKLNTNLNMKTNVTDKEEKFIELKSSMLKIPETSVASFFALEEYPYFTDEVKYPRSYLHGLTYRAKIEFFFNHDNFIQTLTKYNRQFVIEETDKYTNPLEETTATAQRTSAQGTSAQGTTAQRTSTQGTTAPVVVVAPASAPVVVAPASNAKFDKRNEICEYNIMTMLKCIFPIKYPYPNNIKSSYNMKIRKSLELNFEIPQQVLNFFRIDSDKDANKSYAEYSYLKIDGKTYTVSEAIWLNDIFNHPIYKKIVKAYSDLIFFKKTFKNQANEDIANKIALLNDIKNRLIITDLEEIKRDLTYKIIEIQQPGHSRQLFPTNMRSTSIYESELNDSLNTINHLIREITTIKTQKLDDKQIVKLLDQLNSINRSIDLFKRKSDTRAFMLSQYSSSFKMTQEIKDLFENIDSMYKTVKEIYELNLIQKYLKDTKFNTKILSDNNISQENKEKIKKYSLFFEEIKKIEKYYSKNSYLENIKKNYLNKKNEDFIKLLTPANVSLTPPPEGFDIKALNTSVNTLFVEDKNEIYVRIDLIEGEVTDENQSDIKCSYSGEKLTDRLDTLLSIQNKFWELNPRRMLYVVDEKKGYSKVGVNVPIAPTENKNPVIEPKKDEVKIEDRPMGRPTDNYYDDDFINPFMLRNMLGRAYGGEVPNKSKTHKNNKSISNTRKLKSYYMIK